ncbi:MAG: accessory factor UbiK family protein [Gammaproteobacteria bacterium]|nr:accessory factor UbiK family protein [Gammaproteobacteria bacterium]MDH5729406.1 accessory factor UbiK family protein [Gammaproteobacteria bacterium]
MFDASQIDAMAKKLSDALPPGFNVLREDLEKNFRDILQSMLSRLDLVTREEFDVQVALLAKTQERLNQLAQQLQHLEQQTINKE